MLAVMRRYVCPNGHLTVTPMRRVRRSLGPKGWQRVAAMGYRENVLMNKSDGRKKVLFVCVGNACRSLMAEAIARQDAPDAIDAFSAGFMPIGFVPELTKQTLMKNGYWTEGLESKGISSAAWKRADVVINMSGRPIEEAFRKHSKVVDWEIKDPFDRGPEDYQRVFDENRRLPVFALAASW